MEHLIDPFEVLDLPPQPHEARDIIQAVGRALRQRHAPARQIADAQRALLDPIQKAAYEFQCIIDVVSLRQALPPAVDSEAWITSELTLDPSAATATELARDAALERLDVFDAS